MTKFKLKRNHKVPEQDLVKLGVNAPLCGQQRGTLVAHTARTRQTHKHIHTHTLV